MHILINLHLLDLSTKSTTQMLMKCELADAKDLTFWLVPVIFSFSNLIFCKVRIHCEANIEV